MPGSALSATSPVACVAPSSSTARSTLSACRPESTTRAPSATSAVAVARPEAARAARDDVHLSLQTEIHADTLARNGQAERTANWVS